MKATELMIEDWVYDTILKCNTQVEMLSLSGIRGDCNDNIWNEKTFEPIPLTAEILEKNGFTHRNSDKVINKQSWTFEDGDCTIHAKYNFGFLYFDIYGKPLKPNMFAPHVTMHIQYAHELQHILKDCRIDKEIVL